MRCRSFFAFALLFGLLPALLTPTLAQAGQCHGQNLIAALPPGERAALAAKADVPFAQGNLWRATKGSQTILFAGTFHMADPRFVPMVAQLEPYLGTATALYVEAGPGEQTALKAKVLQDPSLMFLTNGPTLTQQLSDADWQRLSAALKARGMVPTLAAKMQPWLLASMLEMPACMFPISAGSDAGLDKLLMDRAAVLHLPVKALEPFDAVLGIFAKFTVADQLAMLTQTVASDAASDDMATTLADSYFAGQSRLYWELTRAQMLTLPGMTAPEADREMALVDTAIIASRNAAWIPVLERGAQNGPIIAAFGALHLPGETGVLNLLAKRGWTVTPLSN